MKVLGVYFILILLIPGALMGIDFEPQGFVDTYHAVRLNALYDFLSSRTRLRLEMWFLGEDASLFASMNAVNNSVITSNTRIELREAYMDYISEGWDLRIGRQIIIWGKADGIAITDIVSPQDYTEFLAQDFDDIRLPVDAARLRFLFNTASIEVLWLPVFRPAVSAPPGTPWYFKYDLTEGVEIEFDTPIEPDLCLKNSEIGGRLSFYLSQVDFALSFFYTWDDFPVYYREITGVDPDIHVLLKPEHERLIFIGSEFSAPWRDFVLRGEAAFYAGKYFEPEDMLSETMYKRNSLNYMVGLDWTPGDDWMLTAQFADSFICDYMDRIKNDKHTMLAILNISKKLFRQTLELSTMGYFGIIDKDCFVRTGMDYALTDELHIMLGVDLFIGDEGMVGQFVDNDEVWIKAKYSF